VRLVAGVRAPIFDALALIATIVAVAAGSIVLVPALVLLFGLFVHGQFDRTPDETPRQAGAAGAPGRHTVAAIALMGGLAGTGLLVFADNGWLRALGVACLTACAISTFMLAATADESGELAVSRAREGRAKPGSHSD
jgi:cytochrome bd ubiquinol oxidase subunit II